VGSTHLAVLGGGAWGTALAVHLADLDYPVRLWVRESDLVERMIARRDNPLYLPGIAMPDRIVPTHDLAEAVDGARLLVGVVPSPFAREVYRAIAAFLDRETPVAVATKGIEEHSLALPLDVARDELGDGRGLAVISGPSFASELVRGKPTAVVVASARGELSEEVQRSFSSPALRLYTSADPIGVQVAGALKNVIAIAAGVADSLQMGPNAQAALVTRGLAEITRLGTALGARGSTFAGLAGLGDLVLTCTGDLSRNRTVGRRLGRGERLEDIVADTRAVAEGIRTTRSARELARRHGIEMPIVTELYRLLFEEGPPAEILARLMSRPLTSEECSERRG
jgi:glycerol-3-phosphate dehydrogenase (NAD(P)+)